MLARRDRTIGGTTVKLYAVSDWRHNIMAVVNASAGVEERYTYDPFGMVHLREAISSPRWRLQLCANIRLSPTLQTP